jgi:hypothetical protein
MPLLKELVNLKFVLFYKDSAPTELAATRMPGYFGGIRKQMLAAAGCQPAIQPTTSRRYEGAGGRRRLEAARGYARPTGPELALTLCRIPVATNLNNA